MKKIVLASSLAAMNLLSAGVHAESMLVTGSGSAVAKLDFRVIIPRVLFLSVGSGTLAAPSATTNRVTFDYTNNSSAVGTGAAAAVITNTGPTPAGSALPVTVIGNNGQITLTSTNSGNLVNAASPPDTIPFSEITAVSSAVQIPVPAATGASVNVPLTFGTKVTNASVNWTFSFSNSTTFPVGTYDGRVTYTAAMP